MYRMLSQKGEETLTVDNFKNLKFENSVQKKRTNSKLKLMYNFDKLVLGT